MHTSVLEPGVNVTLYSPDTVGLGFGMDFAIVEDPAAAKTSQGVQSFYWGGAFGTWFWIDPINDMIVIGMIQNQRRLADRRRQSGGARAVGRGDLRRDDRPASLREPRLMQTVRLGRTGLTVSVAGLGCGGHSRLGMAKGKDVHHAADMVRRALDLGVTFIDTARAYGTEEAVGMGVKGRRDEAVISSKAGIGRGTELMSAADMARYVDDCLKKLDTDHVDVFHLHGVTPAQYPHARDVMVPELKRQQAAGKLRFLAISEQFGGDTGHAMFRECLADDLFDVVMVGFNLLNPSARAARVPADAAAGRRHADHVRGARGAQPAGRAEEGGGRADRRAARSTPARVDADDPLGFLGDGRAVVRSRLPLLPPRAGRRRHPDRHRRSGAPEGQRRGDPRRRR